MELKLKRRAKGELRDRAILVHVSPCGFSVSRYDRIATKEFEASVGAIDAGKYVKIMFTKDEIKEITNAQGKARQIHYKYTLPWITGGLRIMSVLLLEDFTKEINEIQDILEKAVQSVVKNYDEIKLNAKRRLGKKLFVEEEFPTKEDIKERFKIEVRFFPVPDKSDFRTDVPANVIESFEENTGKQYKEAVDEMWSRFRTVLEKAIEQLSKDKGKLFESVLENIRSLTEILPKLNIVGDKKMNVLVKMANDAFEDVDIDDLRQSKKLKKRKVKETKEILDKMSHYLN